MKKTTKTAAVAAAFLAALNMNACAYGPPPGYDDVQTEYGPPEYYGTETPSAQTGDFQPDDNDVQMEYAPAPYYEEDYHPEEDEIQDVYGPPDWYQDDDDADAASSAE